MTKINLLIKEGSNPKSLLRVMGRRYKMYDLYCILHPVILLCIFWLCTLLNPLETLKRQDSL